MQVFKKIGIIFIVSLLITATGGFSIYHHICHCVGEQSSSIFFEAECAHGDDPASCCHAEKSASCCQQKEKPVKKHACHDDHCCQDSFQFFKINDSFQPELQKVSLKPLMVLEAVLFYDICEDITPVPYSNMYSSDLPPPETGKQILTAHHQLKLDTPLV